jgi:hypothetical protein
MAVADQAPPPRLIDPVGMHREKVRNLGFDCQAQHLPRPFTQDGEQRVVLDRPPGRGSSTTFSSFKAYPSIGDIEHHRGYAASHLIPQISTIAPFYTRVAGRRSTVRASQSHHSQTSPAARAEVARWADLDYPAAAATLAWKACPVRSTAHPIRADLLARATTTVFLWALASRSQSHSSSGVALLDSDGKAARAPWISSWTPSVIGRGEPRGCEHRRGAGFCP